MYDLSIFHLKCDSVFNSTIIHMIHSSIYTTYLSACPEGWFGELCFLPCQCKNNATCDPLTGGCTCRPGHVGENCDEGKKSGGTCI